MSKLISLLNCITNAQSAGYNYVVFSYSNYLYFILNILVEEGFVKGFLIQQKRLKKKEFCILLKYKNDRPVIKTILIKSKGSNICFKAKDLFKMSNGVGVHVISTSKGLMTGDDAFNANLGGELLFSIQ